MSKQVEQWKRELVQCIHFLHNKGYAPATSSNYSFRMPRAVLIHISSSGKDKGTFKEADIMEVDLEGRALDAHRRPSAETLLHTLIYRNRPEATCVLHTHSVYNTVLSGIYEAAGKLELEGYEVLKGLSGVRTHETAISVPVFANSQDMPALAVTIQQHWEEQPDMPGFLLAKHGCYTWGTSIAEAKRHIEVLEFLFECTYKMHTFNTLQNTMNHGSITYS